MQLLRLEYCFTLDGSGNIHLAILYATFYSASRLWYIIVDRLDIDCLSPLIYFRSTEMFL